MLLQTAGKTDPGRTRKKNEDALWVDPLIGLLAVADGMGGHRSGDVASAMAIGAIPEHFKALSETDKNGRPLEANLSPEANRLGACLKLANRRIFEAAQRRPQDKGMGCTCTAALIHDGKASVAHVGDSRAYLIRRGEMKQLTADHSLVMDQVRQGLISREEAKRSSLQNVLTRALGTQPEVEVDLEEHPLYPNDILLLCSDGLFKELSDEEILQSALRRPEPWELAEELISRANDSGGHDNITVAIARPVQTGFSERLKAFLGL